MNETPAPSSRPLGVVHLIFGLVFTGIAAIWLIGEANDADAAELAAGFPAVLIGAGIIGLVAILVNQRRSRTCQPTAAAADPVAPADPTDPPDPTDPTDRTAATTAETEDAS